MGTRLHISSNRIEFLDTMKGLGILLLLLSHSIPGDSPLKTWIFSFHMPLFFWCSGYLIAERTNKKALQGKLGITLRKKGLSRLVPYLFFSLLIIVFYALLELLHSHTVESATVIDNLLRVIELRGMESLWFLPCLFLAECLFYTLYAYFPCWTLGVVCLLGIVLNFVFNHALPNGILGTLIRSTTVFVFVYFGAVSNRLKKQQWIASDIPWLCLIFIIIGAVVSQINGFAAIGSYEFGFVPFYYVSAAITLIGCMGLCQMVHNWNIVPFLGKNSIVVLCTNNILIELLRLLDSKLCRNFFLSHGMTGNFLFAALITILEIPIILG